MKRKNKDGIIFDNTVYLSEANKRSFPLYMRLLQLLAVLSSSYCFITILIRCFNLEVLKSLLLGGIILMGCVFFIFIIYSEYDLIKLIFVTVIYGGMFYFLFEHIKNGFYLLENAIIECAGNYYGFPIFRFVAEYTTAERDLTLLLIMILIPMTGIFALSLLRGKLNWLCYIIMLIPVAVSFAMGVTPPEVHLIAYILIFLFLSISNGSLQAADNSRNKYGKVQKSMIYRINIRSASVVCILSLLLFFVLKLLVPVDKYNNYNEIHDAKLKIQNFMTDFSIEEVSDKIADVKWNIRSDRLTSSGGLSLGELGRVDQVIYDETEHLHVKAPLKSVLEGIYLKGYVGSVYTGDSWKTHTREFRKNYEEFMADVSGDYFEPAIGSSILLNHYPFRFFTHKGRIGITYKKANKHFVYAPYFSDFKEKDGVRFEYDLAITSDKELKIGTYDYFYNLIDGINDNFLKNYDIFQNGISIDSDLYEYKKNEEKYRSFVYETYTKLPENGLDRLKNDFSKEAIGQDAENLVDAILYIKNYLDSNTRYTLSPGRLPKGKDFVEYFLYENKLGYCAHYASAGALMLRAMGYPARYVEGYAIGRSDLTNSSSIYLGETGGEDSIVEVTVKDYNAHAWVEVYYDGFGWIPLEFTAVSGMEDMVDIIADIDGYTQAVINEIPTVPPTQAPPSPSPTEEEPKEEIIPTPQPESLQEIKDQNDSDLVIEDDKPTTSPKRYLTVLPVIIMAGVILYFQLNKNRKNANINESFSMKALRLYEKIERLFIIGNLLPKKTKCLEENEEYVKKHLDKTPIIEFEKFMNTVKKARFGKTSISFEEYLDVKLFYNTLHDRIYNNLSREKRIYLKILSLIKI